ncbi:hypothetical protein PH213_20255 [Streptomyces sp. SRF1]|uniref:hypothetical protein n=1 Tax=Streptomyces sp. SRF1 TaxID=1549642 RepID=UPI0025B0D668|nr:hypothetical protein [Streptomyces sp. SRF1]MDN3056839.1 hypothetical protein [Streptomyces sp. SRF1]
MALRGGPARRLPGNALGSMLRDLDRRTRTTSRRTGRRLAPDGPAEPREGPPGPRGPAGPPAPVTTAATVAVTGDDGRARWEFPAPYDRPPVLTALPVDPDPGEDRTVTIALEEITAVYAVVRVWRTRPRRGHGVADPAGRGILVHLIAAAATG